MHKVRIETKGTTARIFIDETEVLGVTGYSIRHNVTDAPIPELHLSVIGDMEINGEMQTPIPAPWSKFYTEKTPPISGVDEIIP